MSQIDRIVSVNITRETQQLDIASFDIPLILVRVEQSENNLPRVQTFTSLDAVADVFDESSNAYLMAQKLLSQEIRPSEFKIGKVGYVDDPLVPETYAEALQAVLSEDDTWYALLADTHLSGDVQAIAAIIQANRRMYFTSTSDSTIIDPMNDEDIGSILHDAGYFRTAVIYSTTANTEFPEAAWVGSQIVEIPGSNTWEYKQLAGVTVSNLSDNDIQTLEDKGVNYFVRIKGAAVTRKGVSADESWIDEIIFVDWLQARIQEQVFFRLINKKKVPLMLAA